MEKFWEDQGLQVVPYRHGYVVQHAKSGLPFGGVPCFLFEDAMRQAMRLISTGVNWSVSIEELEAEGIVYYHFGSIWEWAEKPF